MPSDSTQVNRQLKVHKKSRQGCGNCKLRKIKCDESKPKCKKCISFGVLCNYDGTHSDLQLSANGTFKIDVMDFAPSSNKPNSKQPIVLDFSSPPLQQFSYIPSPNLTTPSLSLSKASCNASSVYQLTDNDFELLGTFQSQTVFTISTEQNRPLYQIEMIRLAFSHPQLMHAILSLTLMHVRALQRLTTPLTTQEATHWYLATSLFTSRLASSPIPEERDPLWATALFLGLISIFYLDASNPSEAWPLAPPNLSDLSWLQMTDGKNAVWKALGPPDGKGVLNRLYTTNTDSYLCAVPGKTAGLETLPSELLTLLNLSSPGTTEDDEISNPYLKAATLLAQAISSKSIVPTIIGFFSFVSTMSPSFKTLLFQKDPGALLLLMYWYAQMLKFSNWWIERRARLEGGAICLYLEMRHEDPALERLLEGPRKIFGL